MELLVSIVEVIMDAEVESVMASSQDQREEELQVITNSLSCKLSCVDSYGQNCYKHTY